MTQGVEKKAQNDGVDDEALDELTSRLDVLEKENRLLRLAVEELERIAQRDTLTPLYNRRYFLTALSAAISRAGRYGDESVLIFCDVNGLKRINDEHGHTAGDFALVLIAERLASVVRTTDTVARLGGDEFGLILEKTDSDKARDKVTALSAALAAPCQYGDHDLPLSAAFGIVGISADVSAEALLEQADKAMYQDKVQHRSVM